MLSRGENWSCKSQGDNENYRQNVGDVELAGAWSHRVEQ